MKLGSRGTRQRDDPRRVDRLRDLVTPDGEATLLEPTDRDEPPPGLEPSIESRTVEEVTRAATP